MPTLLVNPKMDPALAARVRASVTGQRGKAPAARSTARLVATMRWAVLLGVAGVVAAIVLQVHRDRDALASQRSLLFKRWAAQASSFSQKERSFLPRLERLLARYSGPYSGDVVADTLRVPGGLAALLARPSVYVRGPMEALGTSVGLAKAANDAGKDSLLLCLLAPTAAASRSEKDLLKPARLALAGGAPMQALTPQVHRLLEAEIGLPFVMPRWAERIRSARDAHVLERLELALAKAPIAEARTVVRSELVIAALDEAPNRGATTELDGENAHYVRVAVVELDSGAAPLVVRREVDPSWVTPNRRSLYARELDGCKLGLEIRDLVLDAAEERDRSLPK